MVAADADADADAAADTSQLGADGGPPFCELRNGPRSNARDKFTGRRAERSRLKNTAFVQPVKKGLHARCVLSRWPPPGLWSMCARVHIRKCIRVV